MNAELKWLIEYFKHRHDVYANHKYSVKQQLPYSFHLEMVNCQLQKFFKLDIDTHGMNQADNVILTAAAYGHDSIEDTRLTYNDVKNLKPPPHNPGMFGQRTMKALADIIFACTEFRGRDRDERHPEEYVNGIASDKFAAIVKLADLSANATFSLMEYSSMYFKMMDEWDKKWMPAFHKYDTIKWYPKTIAYINNLYNLNQ